MTDGSEQVASGDMIRRANEIARRLAAAGESPALNAEEQARCRTASRHFEDSLDALERFVAQTERAIAARSQKAEVAA